MATLYRNARVYPATSATDPPPVTALLVDGESITWLGGDDDARAQSARDVVDLDGALVTPAFVDAHVHTTDTGLTLTAVDLRACRSVSECLDLVEQAARSARGRSILGTGWDETGWAEGRPPTAGELDRVSSGGLVYLSRVDMHSAVVSTALLADAGPIDHTSLRADGWVGEPGHDQVRTAALRAIRPAQRRAAQLAALREAAELGIASVHEMAGPAISSAEDLAALLELAGQDDLPHVAGYWGELGGVGTARRLGATGAGGDLFCDGSFGSHTAALHDPYTDRPDRSGLLRYDVAELVEHIVACVEAGLPAGFHAIGDAAVDQVLDAYEQATRRTGRPLPGGHRIEHAEYVRDPRRLSRSGLVASVQPGFDAEWGGPDRMYAQRLGRERALALNRFGELAAAGVPLVFGSDSPVTPLGPWSAVRAAVHPADGSPGLAPAAAFAAHTVAGWRAAGIRDEGTLAVGAPATFAIWRTGDLPLAADGLPDLAPDRELPVCVATVRRGRALYDAGILTG